MAPSSSDTPLASSRSAVPSLEDRELSILQELAREGDARVAFQGLRRKLDLHQQALARTLRRLEDAGLVDKNDDGYRLSEQGFASLSGLAAAGHERPSLTVAEALLPPGLGPSEVAQLLSGRWFHGLHWYGESRGPGETTLIWLTDPGGARVRVRVTTTSFTLEVEDQPERPQAVYAAARGILAALAELYGIASDDAPVASLSFVPGAAFAA